MNKYVVCDLDGTLYNHNHRLDYAMAKDWEGFHNASAYDTPNMDVRTGIFCFYKQGFELIALTGRTSKHRTRTVEWMNKWEIPIDQLLMRPDDDYRPDAMVKVDLLQEFFAFDLQKARKEVLVILEDRDVMVETWRNMGFECWQVRQGIY